MMANMRMSRRQRIFAALFIGCVVTVGTTMYLHLRDGPSRASDAAVACDRSDLMKAFDQFERPRYPSYDQIGFAIASTGCRGDLALAIAIHNESDGQPRGTHVSEALFRWVNGRWLEIARSGPALLPEDVSLLGVTSAQLDGLRATLK
jgi:hypothetical protein